MSLTDEQLGAMLLAAARELSAVVDKAIGERTIRYTLIVAVPAASDDPEDVGVTTCGNATPRLTRMMMQDQLVKLSVFPELRRDVPRGGQ